jgi:dTDP-4-dehydrorhamnose reductase
MLRLAAEREALSVVSDQLGAPTSARMIADVTAHALWQAAWERRAGAFQGGIFNLSAGGVTSWHGFASRIIDAARSALPASRVAAHTITPIPATSYPTPARRPGNSLLDNTKLEHRFNVRRQSWQDALGLVLDEVFDQAAVRPMP